VLAGIGITGAVGKDHFGDIVGQVEVHLYIGVEIELLLHTDALLSCRIETIPACGRP